MGGHGGAFAQRNIGWVADEPLNPRQADPGLAVEEIELMEGDMGAEMVGVPAGDVKGAGADVAGMDREGGELAGYGDGDTAAAGADVEDGAAGGAGEWYSDGPLDEFFGLGPWDEDVLVDVEPQPGEPAFV